MAHTWHKRDELVAQELYEVLTISVELGLSGFHER